MTSDNDHHESEVERPRPVIKGEPMKPLPKRFYKDAATLAVEGGFAVTLDGRQIRTPGKRLLHLPTEALAAAIAAEWQAQGERIDPGTMPLTRIANSAIDSVSHAMDAVRDDTVAFGGTDLLCYRAGEPDALVKRQRASWDPILLWAREAHGVHLVTAEGVMHVAQDRAALERLRRSIEPLSALELSALHVMTTLTGSVLLALAHTKGRLTAEQTWEAAHVDDRWQVERWGPDAEASLREAVRRAEFEAASRLFELLA